MSTLAFPGMRQTLNKCAMPTSVCSNPPCNNLPGTKQKPPDGALFIVKWIDAFAVGFLKREIPLAAAHRL
jgi:hypothetical protein